MKLPIDKLYDFLASLPVSGLHSPQQIGEFPSLRFLLIV